MIVVTGGNGGLGRAVVSHFEQKGIETFTISRSGPKKGTRGTVGDVSDFESLVEIAKSLRKKETLVTTLVNAAGVASMSPVLFQDTRTIQNLINVNLLGTINSCRAFLPSLIRAGGGQIINLSSIAVPTAIEGEAVYSAAKAGVEQFTRVFAKEVASHGVRVNCVAPGPIRTPLISGVPEDKVQRLIGLQTIRREFLPEEFAKLIDCLNDDASSSLSGQVFRMGGV